MEGMNSIKANLATVLERLSEAALASGRSPTFQKHSQQVMSDQPLRLVKNHLGKTMFKRVSQKLLN
jgi:hypothetical protein